MAEAATIDTASAEGLIETAKSRPGEYVPSPEEAGKMSEDLRAREAEGKGKLLELGTPAGDAGAPAPAGTPDRTKLLEEASRRGLLDPEQKALYAEAQRRGLTRGGRGQPPADVSLTPLQESIRTKLMGESGPMPDVDYKSGTDWLDKVSLDQADSPEEKRLYLEQKYGKDAVQQDPNGIFYVTLNNKKIAPGGGGFLSRLSADVAAEAPVFAGATMGAIAGAPAGPGGAAVGAAGGGAAGKAAIEAFKRLGGRSSKSLPEELGAIGKTGLEMGASEMGGQVVSRGIGRLTSGRVPSLVSGTTPESRRLSAITTESGAAPPIRSALPDMRVTQFHQALGEKLGGSMTNAKNVSYIEKEMGALLKSVGMSEAEIPVAMKEILNPSAALSTEALGRDLGPNVQGYAAGLGEAALAAKTSAESTLERQLAEIKLLTRERVGPGQLAEDVSDKFRQARKDFSRAMQRVYSKIDDLVGDKPVVPTFLAKRKARNLIQKMPESDIKKIVQEIADMRPNETFENMQRMRTRLAEMGEPANLAASGLLKKDLRDLRTAIDRAFDQAFLGNAPQAARILRVADDAYANGIKKFENDVLNQIVNAVKGGTPPDPEVIARLLLQKGNTSQVGMFKDTLGPDLWKRVVAQDWRDMVEISSEKGEIDTMRFFREVQKRKRTGVLEEAYGSHAASEIDNFSRRQAVLTDKLPVSALNRGDSFEGAVLAAQKGQKALEEFVDENFLGALADPNIAPEAVYSSLVQPGKETLLERAFEHFTRDSPEVAKIRQTAMKSLLKNAIVTMETGAGRTVGPDALRSALSKYTPKQQELLFPDGLADDLNLLADEAKFLFPKGQETVAGFVAGGIKAALPFGAVAGGLGHGYGVGESALAAYGWGIAWNWVLSKPSVVRWLANGIASRDTAVREATDQTFRAIVRAGTLGMLPGQQASD